MKWRLSGFSQVVQIRAPVSATELRFPPARTSQQTSTSIIRLMDLIRAGAASPGLGAGEARGAGGQRSPGRAAEGRAPFPRGAMLPPAGTWRSPLPARARGFGQTPFLAGSFEQTRTSASPRRAHQITTGPPPRRLHPSTLSPPSYEHPRPCGLREGAGARPRVGAVEEEGRGFCKLI